MAVTDVQEGDLDLFDLENPNEQAKWSRRGCPDGSTPCLLCGRPVKNEAKTTKWFLVHHGGSHIVTEARYEELNAAGRGGAQLGLQPIGPECYRQHKSLLEPYL